MAALGEPHPLLHEALPSYEIGDELGRGAFGVVLAAHHRQLGRQVAIKQLAAPPHSDQAIHERFQSEARLLASFDHPHVVPLYDFVEADGVYLLVMECLTGGTVQSHMASLSPPAACAVVVAACAGLHYAHGKGVLHRDVKPANLMFSTDGVVKVTDFGIAKVLGGSSQVLTHTGVVVGTPHYMAPEQIAGAALGPATDVYATGLVLYELLSGALPFPDVPDPMAALFQRLAAEPIPLLDRAPGAPRALAPVVARALQREPPDRYASARDLALAVVDAAAAEWGGDWQAETGLVLRDSLPHRASWAGAPAGTSAASAPSLPPVAPTGRETRPRRSTARPSRGRVLLERDGEMADIEGALHDGCAGAGSVVTITAPAGMGKTRLMQEAARAARERQMRALVARGEQLERDFPFGVVRQLFEPAVMRLDAGGRTQLLAGAATLAGDLLLGEGPSTAPVGENAVDHALYWFAANLATSAPLALIVDDAHWADRPSLRALLHLVVRLEGLPIAVVLATRPAEPAAHQDLLDRLTHHPLTYDLRPQPLSEAAVGALLVDRLRDADAEFSRACHAASAGNPFLVSELTSALEAAGVSPTAGNAERVRSIGPQTIARSVLLRLAGEPPEAGALARALAILGGRAGLAHAARTAGLDEPAAGIAADALARVDILSPGRPLEFAHPIVRAAVYDALPRAERATGHLAAARMLHADGTAPETVASHLLHTEPAGDAWVVDRLRDAAAAATGVGAMEATVTYLQRALQEPAPADQRAELLLWLSEGHRHQNAWEEAADALRDAIREAPNAKLRVEAARRLFSLLLPARRHDEAARELQPLVTELRRSEPYLAEELELSLSDALWLDTDQAPMLATGVRAMRTAGSGASRRDRIVLSRRAWAGLVAGDGAPAVGALARSALRSGELITEDARAHGFEMSVLTLALTDEFAEAHAHLAAAMEAARARGHLGRWAFLSTTAAHVFLLEGRLADAEEHALQALDMLRPDGIAFPAALDALVDALLERDQLAAAWHVYEQFRDRGPLPDSLLFAGLRLTRARLLIAAGDLPAALDHVLAAGHRQLQLARPNPAWCPWRSTAALIHLQLGWPDAALGLADEELELARAFGARRAHGVALRVAGLCHGGEEGLELLQQAVGVLDGSGAELEHARALVDLGATARRAGQRGDAARDPLRGGREIAQRLGAQALAARAHEELLAAGARPRRTALRGVDALTPSERRVCELAADGRTNRQIAQALFVTVKTVEGHLAAGYAKLGIARRRELAGAMAGGEAT